MSSEPQFEEFNFYVHAGRYEGSREAPSPRHVFLVERGRERAHFLDLLYMKSGLGSYLVTGVRGVGKTSFVRYCVDTYVRDVYERYCRSVAGRGYIDKLSIFCGLALPFLVALTLSPVALSFWQTQAKSPSALAALTMALLSATLALITLFPLLVAYQTRRSLIAHGRWKCGSLLRWLMIAGLPHGLALAWIGRPWLGRWSWLRWLPLAAMVAIVATCSVVLLLQRPQKDGFVHSKSNLKKCLDAAQCVGILRLLGLSGISASLLAALGWRAGSNAHLVWWQELGASAGCSAVLALLIYLEKRKLLQPTRRMVFETAIHPFEDDSVTAVQPANAASEFARTLALWLLERLTERRTLRRSDAYFAELAARVAFSVEDTLFYALFQRWLPVLRVNVNLGLDRLSHKHIIESMLRGLHQQLTATFRRPFTALSVLKYALGALVWAFVMHLHQPNVLALVDRGARDPMLILPTDISGIASFILPSARTNDTPSPASAAAVGPATALRGVAEVSSAAGASLQVTFRLLASSEPPPSAVEKPKNDEPIKRSIDLLWGALLGLTLIPLGRWLVWLPHQRACRDISALLESLSSRVTLENKSAESSLSSPKLGIKMPSRTRRVETDPRDPRSLEQAFLAILEAIRNPTRAVLPGLYLSLPAPETIFIFDELDKVGTTTTLLDPSIDDSSGFARDVERERSRKLQALLSDLKNLLGMAQARFIFVGGRNLHDEWLADEVNRQPLLSNIFDAEIYVRTLLTDHTGEQHPIPDQPRRAMTWFTISVSTYLEAQMKRADDAWRQWCDSAGAGKRARHYKILPPTFLAGRKRGQRAPQLRRRPFFNELTGAATPVTEFWDAFVRFVAFRSRGIPRRARLILETFIRPYDRVAPKRAERRPAQHVLYFTANDRVRIELVSELYRSLARSPNSLDWRDDKVVLAVFQFSDFLTRFHRRAFSLQSLERFEELMHVHRAPDTSTLAARLIADWLGTLLETTAAGIHTYRFRLEWAAEFAYVSILSQHESASANFTLDEAQALKAQLRAMLTEVAGTGGAFEVHTALAELHDLDGDHLDARHHFRKAIEILDERLKQEYVTGAQDGKGAVARVLSATGSGGEMERQLDWALARLRVILQLGLTYERTFDYERAGLEYADALQVARAIWNSKGELRPSMKSSSTALLEPIFAQAWAALKDPLVTVSPFESARDWLTELLLTGHYQQKSKSARWTQLKGEANATGQWSRELNMLGDLAFFLVPRWPKGPNGNADGALANAREAYESAARAAERAGQNEQQARSAFSLALCELLEHRDSKGLDFEIVEKFVRRLKTAREFAYQAPSSQGPFADSMAIYQVGLEVLEEIFQLRRTLLASGMMSEEPAPAQEECVQSRLNLTILSMLADERGEATLSPLRQRILSEAKWRLRCAMQRSVLRDGAPKSLAFPARSRILNYRTTITYGSNPPSNSFATLLQMCRHFDGRSTFAPCRVAIGARRPFDEANDLWQESIDTADGGKNYFSWLRNRYYLEDGFGPMLLRANFVLTVGFVALHRELDKDARLMRKTS